MPRRRHATTPRFLRITGYLLSEHDEAALRRARAKRKMRAQKRADTWQGRR